MASRSYNPYQSSGMQGPYIDVAANAMPLAEAANNFAETLQARNDASSANMLMYNVAQMEHYRKERDSANQFALAHIESERQDRKLQFDQFLQLQQARAEAQKQDYQAEVAQMQMETMRTEQQRNLSQAKAATKSKGVLSSIEADLGSDPVSAAAHMEAFRKGAPDVFADLNPVTRSELLNKIRTSGEQTSLVNMGDSGGSITLNSAVNALKTGNKQAQAEALATLSMHSGKDVDTVAGMFDVRDPTTIAMADERYQHFNGNESLAKQVSAIRADATSAKAKLSEYTAYLSRDFLRAHPGGVLTASADEFAGALTQPLNMPPEEFAPIYHAAISAFGKAHDADKNVQGVLTSNKVDRFNALGIDATHPENLLQPTTLAKQLLKTVLPGNLPAFNAQVTKASADWVIAMTDRDAKGLYKAENGQTLAKELATMYRLAGQTPNFDLTSLLPVHVVAGMRDGVEREVERIKGMDANTSVLPGVQAALDKAGKDLWVRFDGTVGGTVPKGNPLPEGGDYSDSFLAKLKRVAATPYSFHATQMFNPEARAESVKKALVPDDVVKDAATMADQMGFKNSSAQAKWLVTKADLVAVVNSAATGMTSRELSKTTPTVAPLAGEKLLTKEAHTVEKFLGMTVDTDNVRVPGLMDDVKANLDAYIRSGATQQDRLDWAKQALGDLNKTESVKLTGKTLTLAHFAPDSYWLANVAHSLTRNPDGALESWFDQLRPAYNQRAFMYQQAAQKDTSANLELFPPYSDTGSAPASGKPPVAPATLDPAKTYTIRDASGAVKARMKGDSGNLPLWQKTSGVTITAE